jgi:hypothetical protein
MRLIHELALFVITRASSKDRPCAIRGGGLWPEAHMGFGPAEIPVLGGIQSQIANPSTPVPLNQFPIMIS